MVYTKAPILPMVAGPTYKVWTYDFGDYEYHSNVSPGAAVDPTRKTVTVGTLGGVDVTFRNMGVVGDGLVLGLLAGYEVQKVTFSNLTGSVDASGPMGGAYAAYFNGAFSTDLLLKADMLSLSQTLPDLSALGTIPFNDYTVAANFNYRFTNAATNIWVEPTGGFRFTQTIYGGVPSAFGLANGSDTRLQAGVRVGGSYVWNGVLVTPSVTGLAYDDVAIQGLVAADGVNGAPITALPADQGKLRGEMLLASNFDYQNGFSWFGQIEVRGGQDLFGAGGRLGLRYVWGPQAPLSPIYTKAMPAVTSWAGFYAGLSAGARTDRTSWNTQSVDVGLAPANPSSSSFNSATGRVGPYFGYNFQSGPKFVWGVEGDVAWANGKNKQFGIPGTFDPAVVPASFYANDSTMIQANWDATVRLRSGFLVTPSVLLYGTGGLALQDVTAGAACTSVFAAANPGAWCLGASKADFYSKVMAGWTVGAGVETKLKDNWLVRAEYRYADFRSFNHAFFSLQSAADTVTTNVPMQTQTALIGVAYLFR
jgi:outer membrane immunogenic protein